MMLSNGMQADAYSDGDVEMHLLTGDILYISAEDLASMVAQREDTSPIWPGWQKTSDHRYDLRIGCDKCVATVVQQRAKPGLYRWRVHLPENGWPDEAESGDAYTETEAKLAAQRVVMFGVDR